MSRPSATLPNLSGLRLGGPVCPPCQPVGETFEEFEDAQGSVGGEAEKRDDWSPNAWGGANSPDCPICFEPLHRRSGRGDTKEVEALFENPACSHCFHRECLEQWVQGALGGRDKALRCPTCARPIDQTVLNTIFDPSANVQELDSDDGFAAEGEAQRQAAADEAAAREIENQDYATYPAAIKELIRRRPQDLLSNPNPDEHALSAYRLLESAWDMRFNGEGQIPEDLLVATAEGIKTHYDQVTAGFWKTYTEMLIRVTAYLWGDRDDETLWIETMELPRQYARVGIQLFGMGPPMFQGQRVNGIEYDEVKSLVGGREGWLVTAALNIGDSRLRGGNAFNFALEVYRSTDFDESDAMLVDHDGKFVAKVVRSTRRWSMSDFNKAAWTYLKKQNPPAGVGKGLSTSDLEPFYHAVLVALGLPVDKRRIKKRGEYNSYRERESRRDELPEDW